MFPEVKSYLTFLLKFGLSSVGVSCSHESILYILAVGCRSEEGQILFHSEASLSENVVMVYGQLDFRLGWS